MTRLLIPFLLVLLLVPSAYGQTWSFVESADGSEPVERHEAAFVRVDDRFYLLGGRDIRPVSIYDTETRSWTEGSEPPIEIHHVQPVVYDDKIYLIGAMTGGYPDETPVSHVYIYDPSTDSWAEGDPIPEDRRRGAAGVTIYRDTIYVASGIRNGHIDGHVSWLDAYDPATGTWQQLPDAPRARDHFQAVSADGRIYLAGGRRSMAPDETFEHTIGEVDVYDIDAGSWTTLNDYLPTQRAGTSSILYRGDVIVAGGESAAQPTAHAEVEALDVETHQWRTLASLQRGRHGTSLIEYDGRLYTASGSGNRGGSPELRSMELYEPEE